MAEVKVLKVGYCETAAEGEVRADCTITLVRGTTKILVDTGNPQDKVEIVLLLAQEGLTPEDISVVVCTHGHSDHVGNNNLFPHATFVFFHDISQGDRFTGHRFGDEPYLISDDVEVIATPGHTCEDISVLVRTEAGVVAIVGDLFDSEEDVKQQMVRASPGGNAEQQAASRRMILARADYVVPGHGNIFRVDRRSLGL